MLHYVISTRWLSFVLFTTLISVCLIRPIQAADNTTPILRLEPGGPVTQITALAFSSDGQTLYAAGFDKVVRAWQYNAMQSKFTLAPAAYRVPIGPGNRGVLNSLAVSPDGDWLATSGYGATRNDPSFREPGRLRDYRPSATSAIALEEDTIYLFHTRTKQVRFLRGHGGDVRKLTFAPAHPNKPPLLISAAVEPAAPGGRPTSRLRVWDVSKAAYLDDKDKLHDPGALVAELPLDVMPVEHVGLAVQHTGDQPKQVRVGVAWSEGKLRVWDVLAGMLTAKDDGLTKWNNGVVALDSDRLLTTGINSEQRAYLRLWTGASVEPGEEKILTVPAPGTVVAPRGLALISSRDDGKTDHAAVVAIGNFEGGRRGCLQLVQLETFQPVVTLPLWPYEGRTLLLAAAPRGGFVAVAGDGDASVHVYRVRALLEQGEKAVVQKLQGAGVTIRSLAFVQEGQDLGLFLGERSGNEVDPARDVGRIMDFAGRRLVGGADRAAWRLHEPTLDSWRVVEHTAVNDQGRNRRLFDWQDAKGRNQVTLDLEVDAQVTAARVLPPAQAGHPPLLAVATWNRVTNQSALTLYRADTGEALRRLDAHVQPIHALAATRDGRLLASAADDRLVCVWSLTDLDRVLGQYGRIPGLYLQQRGADPVVVQVRPGSPAQDRLQVGDVVTGLVPAGGKPALPVKQAFEYYNAIDTQKPGSKVTLQIRRGGQASQVEVVVGQGVDAPKPLFSLFLMAAAAGEHDWIAWTPLGPFDSSGERIERSVGWHFNPKELEGPVRFAPLEQYRKQFRKETLLKPLVALADIHKAIELVERPISLPRPEIECFVEAANQDVLEPDAHGHYLLREPKARVAVSVRGPSLEQKQVERVGWRILGQGAAATTVPLNQAAGQELNALIPLPEKAGLYTLQFELLTREDTPQTARRELLLRYQPPAPRLTFDSTWQKRYYAGGLNTPATVADPRFPLRVEADRNTTLSLWQNGKEVASQPAQLSQTVDLKPGENVFEVRARNASALSGFEEQEETRQAFVVQYHKKPAPSIALLTVLTPTGSKSPERIRCGECMRVDWPHIQITGEVKHLDKGEPILIQDAGGKTLGRFVLPEGQTRFEEKLRLQPGEQELRFVARSATGEPGEASVRFEYQPALPELVLKQSEVTLRQGEAPPQVDLEGFFIPAADARPFHVTIAVFNDGKKVPQENAQEEIRIAYDENRLQNLPGRDQPATLARLRLAPGLNRIYVTLGNSWKGLTTYEARAAYLRPPRIVGLEKKATADQPMVTLVARVESASPLVHVVCGDRSHPVDKVVRRIASGAGTTYEITLPDLPLAAGKNLFRLIVHNEDGPCLEEGKLEVSFDPRANEKARIVLPKAAEGGVKEARISLAFEVHSFSPLSKVVVRRGERELTTLPAEKTEPAAGGGLVLRGTVPVELEMGPNCFTVEAVNKAGQALDNVAICRVREPVHIEVETPEGAIAEALHTLRGKAIWATAEEGEAVQKKLQGLRVVVNGFRQRGRVELRPIPENPNAVGFQVPVLLNRRANDLQVVCDLPQDPAFERTLSLACANPREPAQLHVFLVGIGVYGAEAKEKLVESAYRALQIDARDQKVKSAVFREVVLHPYRPGQPRRFFVGDVHRGQIMWELERLDRRGSPNDVMLIYWLGPDAQKDVADQEYYLPTVDTLPNNPIRNTGVPLKQLLEGSMQTAGARLLLLDVASGVPPGQQARLELPATQTALVRHAWSRGEPAPGLLQALEQAVAQGKAVSLRELVEVARQQEQARREAVVFSNLDNLVPLATLILTQPAGKP